jgi:hypothetical protein
MDLLDSTVISSLRYFIYLEGYMYTIWRYRAWEEYTHLGRCLVVLQSNLNTHSKITLFSLLGYST